MKYEKQLLAAQQFDGLTADTGLFQPGNPSTGSVGAQRFQVRVNAIRFSCASSVAISYTTTDIADSSKGVELFSATCANLSDDTFRLLSTNDDGRSWNIRFSSDVLPDDALLIIDYDVIATEG